MFQRFFSENCIKMENDISFNSQNDISIYHHRCSVLFTAHLGFSQTLSLLTRLYHIEYVAQYGLNLRS